MKMPNPLQYLRNKVAATQNYIPVSKTVPMPEPAVCTVSGKTIDLTTDAFVKDNKGRYYLISEIATEKYLQEQKLKQ